MQPLDFDTFARLTRNPSPGPDGLPYSVWAATGESGCRMLYQACLEFMAFALHPTSSAASWLRTGPDPSPSPTLATSSSRRQVTRRLSRSPNLSSTRASAVVPGRGMIANIFEAVQAVVLFDIRAAFPSVPWQWIWRVLQAISALDWLATAVGMLYEGSYSDIALAGELTAHVFLVRRGILQGCPASGSLWASLFDSIVWALGAMHHEPRDSLMAFAEILAAAFVNVVTGLGPLVAVSAVLPMTTGLHLHIPNFAIVNYSTYADFDLRRRLHEQMRSSAYVVKRVSRYLGVPIGPSAHETFWDTALGKYSHRCTALRVSASHLGLRVTRYGVCCLSAMRSRPARSPRTSFAPS